MCDWGGGVNLQAACVKCNDVNDDVSDNDVVAVIGAVCAAVVTVVVTGVKSDVSTNNDDKHHGRRIDFPFPETLTLVSEVISASVDSFLYCIDLWLYCAHHRHV